MKFPAKDSGALSWEIRALKNGALQAAAAWDEVNRANGGLNDMVAMWQELADSADQFGAELASLASRLDALGAEVGAQVANPADIPPGTER